MCAKFCCKNFSDDCQVFRILHHYTLGRFFHGHTVQLPSSERLNTQRHHRFSMISYEVYDAKQELTHLRDAKMYCIH